ncbi:MAG: hypothetical protein HY559_01600 [Gammaproteobacteria bacterium]|nr:hypothetical protein [Gammaproteobacteria bacterium]
MQKIMRVIGFLCATFSFTLAAEYDVNIGGKKYQVDTPGAQNREEHSNIFFKNISYQRALPNLVVDSQNFKKERLYHYPINASYIQSCREDTQNYLLGKVSLPRTTEVGEYSPYDDISITMSWYDVKGGNRLREGPKGKPIEHKEKYSYVKNETFVDFGPYPVPTKAGHVVLKTNNIDRIKHQWFPGVKGTLYFTLYQSGCIYPPAIP